jgi:hypothetical protein
MPTNMDLSDRPVGRGADRCLELVAAHVDDRAAAQRGLAAQQVERLELALLLRRRLFARLRHRGRRARRRQHVDARQRLVVVIVVGVVVLRVAQRNQQQ